MERLDKDWCILLQDAKALQTQGDEEAAYLILRRIYESNTFRYNKDTHANYEHYVEEKTTFFVDLARMSMRITGEPERSLPYIDEALILVDGYESVHPCINLKEIRQLKKDYMTLVQV